MSLTSSFDWIWNPSRQHKQMRGSSMLARFSPSKTCFTSQPRRRTRHGTFPRTLRSESVTSSENYAVDRTVNCDLVYIHRYRATDNDGSRRRKLGEACPTLRGRGLNARVRATSEQRGRRYHRHLGRDAIGGETATRSALRRPDCAAYYRIASVDDWSRAGDGLRGRESSENDEDDFARHENVPEAGCSLLVVGVHWECRCLSRVPSEGDVQVGKEERLSWWCSESLPRTAAE